MQLLVSVQNTLEAASALAGGADIIDAKDPVAGALGAVTLNTFASIVGLVDGRLRVSAALGDAEDEQAVETRVRAFARAGASFVKIGFAGLGQVDRVQAMLSAARTGAAGMPTTIVAVAYADCAAVPCLPPDRIAEAAMRVGAAGVLLDTADKAGPGVLRLIPEPQLRDWLRQVRVAGMLGALAGQVGFGDLTAIEQLAPDIVGVRGAVCDGGRNGGVNVAKVRALSVHVRGCRPSRSSMEGSPATRG